jgi:hypothetical protein
MRSHQFAHLVTIFLILTGVVLFPITIWLPSAAAAVAAFFLPPVGSMVFIIGTSAIELAASIYLLHYAFRLSFDEEGRGDRRIGFAALVILPIYLILAVFAFVIYVHYGQWQVYLLFAVLFGLIAAAVVFLIRLIRTEDLFRKNVNDTKKLN